MEGSCVRRQGKLDHQDHLIINHLREIQMVHRGILWKFSTNIGMESFWGVFVLGWNFFMFDVRIILMWSQRHLSRNTSSLYGIHDPSGPISMKLLDQILWNFCASTFFWRQTFLEVEMYFWRTTFFGEVIYIKITRTGRYTFFIFLAFDKSHITSRPTNGG